MQIPQAAAHHFDEQAEKVVLPRGETEIKNQFEVEVTPDKLDIDCGKLRFESANDRGADSRWAVA